MGKVLRVLNIEDSEHDASLLRRHLHRAGYDLVFDRVDTPEAMKSVLQQQNWDVILCDYAMPLFGAKEALGLLQEMELDIPFIVVSGTIGEEVAVSTMLAGADDYLMKDNLLRLGPAIERELEEIEGHKARRQAEEALKASEAELRALFAAMTDVVLVFDRNGRYLRIAPTDPAHSPIPSADLVGKTVHDVFSKEEADCFLTHIHRALAEGKMHRAEYSLYLNGAQVWFDSSISPMSRDEVLWVARDVTEHKHAQARLLEAHKQLVDASRQAGMAEVATAVLHNVGNVLNSINVSASLVTAAIQKSKLPSLAKAVGLMSAQSQNLADFLTKDPKGKQLPDYLKKLAKHLDAEQAAMINELSSLSENIGHIKDIVRMQQAYACVSGVVESVVLAELVEDALCMESDALSHHAVQVIREYGELPNILVDKHKVLQILVNLIRNATFALDEGEPLIKRLCVKMGMKGNNRLEIAVIDNGVGILTQNLTRIFAHGFMTKQAGHGFGLHSAALAAKEMGGTLQAKSEGIGKGATFTLELPLKLEEAVNDIPSLF
jgi:PAS domain S-box-containing protein